MTFLLMYIWTALGVTLALHRYFSHQSYQCGKLLRYLLAFSACLPLQGSILRWAADHRRHHRYHDRVGDVHSPHTVTPGRLIRIRGLLHSHLAWMFDNATTDPRIHAPDLDRQELIRHFDRFYLLYASLSLAIPYSLGYLAGGPVEALRCLLWGGFVRIFLIHHGTWAINSFGHSFGRQDFLSGDRSRNQPLLAILLFGEGWHNNHHAAPSSATLHFLPHHFDLGGTLLVILRKFGLIWNLRVANVETLRRAQVLPEQSA